MHSYYKYSWMNLDKYVHSCNQHLNCVKWCPKSCQQSFLSICMPAVLLMNRQNLFLLPLNLGCTCDLTWPIECGRNEALLVPDLASKGGCFCIWSCYKKTVQTTGNPRTHYRESQNHQAQNHTAQRAELNQCFKALNVDTTKDIQDISSPQSISSWSFAFNPHWPSQLNASHYFYSHSLAITHS